MINSEKYNDLLGMSYTKKMDEVYSYMVSQLNGGIILIENMIFKTYSYDLRNVYISKDNFLYLSYRPITKEEVAFLFIKDTDSLYMDYLKNKISFEKVPGTNLTGIKIEVIE